MNKKQRRKLFKDYYQSVNNRNHIKALEQNRQLYNEIFENYVFGNGPQEKAEGGLDQLEIDATEICKILGLIKLNPMEEL